MKKLMLAVAVALLSTHFAAADAATPRQEMTKACNAEAGDRKGEERKAFVKECVAAKKAEAGSRKTAQQEKMKSCNKDAGAKSLKGEERRKFMSECLKG